MNREKQGGRGAGACERLDRRRGRASSLPPPPPPPSSPVQQHPRVSWASGASKASGASGPSRSTQSCRSADHHSQTRAGAQSRCRCGCLGVRSGPGAAPGAPAGKVGARSVSLRSKSMPPATRARSLSSDDLRAVIDWPALDSRPSMSSGWRRSYSEEVLVSREPPHVLLTYETRCVLETKRRFQNRILWTRSYLPAAFSSSLELRLDSTRRRHSEAVYLLPRWVARRFSEAVLLRRKEPRFTYVSTAQPKEGGTTSWWFCSSLNLFPPPRVLTLPSPPKGKPPTGKPPTGKKSHHGKSGTKKTRV